jgi:hypothetical protein
MINTIGKTIAAATIGFIVTFLSVACYFTGSFAAITIVVSIAAAIIYDNPGALLFTGLAIIIGSAAHYFEGALINLEIKLDRAQS